ncbi:YqaJ viral recombinase family protein [Moraxella atlantae]|uniref:YqaJ viral recombinase family nuclease n=1 Tax=Faucicola atlantae TaxID=34059 RepID=UPI0037510D63
MNAAINPMTSPVIPTKDLSREDWLRLRQSGIGGSDISAIMGFNPYKTAYDLYHDKINDVVADAQTEAAYWGTILEGVVAKEYELRNDCKVQRVNYMIRHPKFDFAIANIDRAVINPSISGNVRIKDGALTTDKLLEVKTASEYMKNVWGDEASDQVPDNYNLQCQWYMGITGVDECDLALLLGGNKYRQYNIKFDAELFEIMINEAQNFWLNHVLARVEPTPTTLANAKHKYARALPDSTLDLAFNDDDNIAKIDRYIELKDQIKGLETELEQAQTDLICLIGEHEALAVEGELVMTYKNQKGRETFDKKGCLKAYPELAEKFAEFTKVGEASRTLRVK